MSYSFKVLNHEYTHNVNRAKNVLNQLDLTNDDNIGDMRHYFAAHVGESRDFWKKVLDEKFKQFRPQHGFFIQEWW